MVLEEDDARLVAGLAAVDFAHIVQVNYAHFSLVHVLNQEGEAKQLS